MDKAVKQDQPRSGQPHHLRRKPMAAVVALALLGAGSAGLAGSAQAADDKEFAVLQKQVAQLKQALADAQQQLAARPAGATAPIASPAQANAAPPADALAAASDKEEDPQSLGEVTVRARTRIEKLQNVPVSVSVVSGKELEREGAADLDSITKRAANVSWNPGNARTSSLSLRGLGKQSQTDAMDPSVGIVVDGLAYSYNPLASFDFYDVDAVQVSRGPQGTAGGRSANLGVISINTRRPSFSPDSDFSIMLGENQRLIARGAIGGPVVDGLLAWRGAFQVDRGSGYVKNAYDDESAYGNHDRVSGRVQFLLTPDPDFSARLAVELTPQTGESFNGKVIYTPTPTTYSNGTPNLLATDAATRLGRRWFTQLASYSVAGSYLNGGGTGGVNLDGQTPTLTDTKGVSAELTWNLVTHTLTSITGYKDMRFKVRNDEGTPFDISKRGGGHLDRFSQLSTELRLASATGGFVDYTTGIYLLSSRNAYDSAKGFGSDAGAWFANAAQYKTLDADGNGRYLLANSLDGLLTVPLQRIRNRNAAIFGQANWHLSDPLTLTTGLRLTREDRHNVTNNLVADNGYGADLNPVAINSVQLGGFNSAANGTLIAGNSPAQLALANAVAQKYFNVSTYNSLSSAQLAQVAAAKALRLANLGVLWQDVDAQPFRKTQPSFVLSPSYRFDERVTGYLSWQYGEKAGIAQNTNGVSNPIRPEKTHSYEAGLKTALLDKTLILNADVFYSTIKDYQQAVQVFDAYTTSLLHDGKNYYTAATGNVAKVQVQGLELDAVYNGIPNTSLRLAGAYNDAVYKDFKNSAQPAENAYVGAAPYTDVSGQNLPGAAKFTLSLGAEYRAPVWTVHEFHTSFNTAYSSRANSDIALSTYGWIPAYSITDFSLGLGKRDKSFDVSVIAKNVFNDRTPSGKTWNSYIPSAPRWLGVMVSGKL
jgi:outer membrane receptor protein involved in Fe transport